LGADVEEVAPGQTEGVACGRLDGEGAVGDAGWEGGELDGVSDDVWKK